MIYLIRHGETVANKQKLYVGKIESELTKKGRLQQSAAVNKLEDAEIHRVISSPRKRCMTLAHEICKLRDINVETEERIAEIDFGIFEGLNYNEIIIKHPKQWQDWVDSGGETTIPQGESPQDFENRAIDFAREIIVAGENENIAIVTHGGVIRTLLCRLLEQEVSQKWRCKVENGAVIKVDITEGFAFIVFD